MMQTSAMWFSAVVVAGCAGTGGDDDIVLVDSNKLGIVAIQIDHDAGDDAVELRGFDASGDAIAVVRRRVGSIADLDQLPGAGRLGTELTVSVLGHSARTITRELGPVQLVPQHETVDALLQIAPIAAALEQIGIRAPRVTAATETPLTVQSCPTNYLNVSPVAGQCCYSPVYTYFVDPNGNIVNRNQYWDASQTPCKASDGTSSCSGASCYYGPNGFTRPSLTTPDPSTPYARIESFQLFPGVLISRPRTYATPQTPEFVDVTGTFATGQGCPGGDSGAGDWDY